MGNIRLRFAVIVCDQKIPVQKPNNARPAEIRQ